MKVDEIKSKEDFILFLERLSNDFEVKSQDWENQNLISFFESMKGWVEDVEDSHLEGNLWTVMSKIILAAKYYE